MINITEKKTLPLSRENVFSLNNKRTLPLDRNSVHNLNRTQQQMQPAQQMRPQPVQQTRPQPVQQTRPQPVQQTRPQPVQQTSPQPVQQTRPQPVQQTMPQPAPTIQAMQIPAFVNPLRKGQKVSIDPQKRGVKNIKVCFGWNLNDARVDMDASAFLLNASGKVTSDDWFVFYSQTESPDRAVTFSHDPSGRDREIINVHLQQLHASVQKIVFVLTINECYENHLNFSMIRDAYVRLLDADTNQEIYSYKLEEYYDNVSSMTLGELYLHNGQWKFNPVGNGVSQDLAGQCLIYGVEIG